MRYQKAKSVLCLEKNIMFFFFPLLSKILSIFHISNKNAKFILCIPKRNDPVTDEETGTQFIFVKWHAQDHTSSKCPGLVISQCVLLSTTVEGSSRGRRWIYRLLPVPAWLGDKWALWAPITDGPLEWLALVEGWVKLRKRGGVIPWGNSVDLYLHWGNKKEKKDQIYFSVVSSIKSW